MHVALILLKKKHTTGQNTVPSSSWTCCSFLFLVQVWKPSSTWSVALSHFPPLCPSVRLSPFVSLPLVLSLSERWHWETAVTWDDSRSWQGFGKPRQRGGRGPLSETGGADLPHYPSLFSSFLVLPLTSTSISYPPPIDRSQDLHSQKSIAIWMNDIGLCGLLDLVLSCPPLLS